jgi:O-antigen ligase
MPFLLFISAQFTYKRFLVFWALAGMLFTHSWLTEPTTPEFWRRFALFSNFGCGLIAVSCFAFSLLVNKANFRFRISGYAIGIITYGLIEAFSCVIHNSASIGVLIFAVAVPIGFGLSFIYAFSIEDLKSVLWGIALFGLIDVIISYSVFLANIFGADSPFPISGLITDRNGFGSYLSIVNVFILIEFLLQKQKLRKSVYGMLVFVIFLGILIQNSRSGYIVYLISSAIVVFASGSKAAKKIFLILLPCLLSLFTFFIVVRIHNDKMNVANYSDIARIYVFRAGINMIKAHPITGIGFRMSPPNIEKFADKKLPGKNYVTTIHNWFVAVWAEMGIFEFIVFCWLNFVMMFSSFKHFTRSGFRVGKYYLFTFTSLNILMIDALVLPNYDYESIYWIILAVGTICLTKAKYSSPALKTANSAF